jgi:hypothetical protein
MPDSGVGDGSRQDAHGPGERGDADRDVDQEHKPPSDPPQIRLDQGARKDWCGKHRQPHHRPEGAEHLAHLVLGEALLEHPESLGDHQCSERALQHPEADQHRRRGCGRTGCGHHGEPGRADQEQPAAAEHVTETCAGDQEHGERERVAGAQPQQGGGAAAERVPDRRTGDVDDRRVHQVHHVRRQDDREHQPAQWIARDGLDRCDRVRRGDGLGHRLAPNERTNGVRYEHCT